MDEQNLILERLDWESDFFSREIYGLSMRAAVSEAELQAELTTLDQKGVWAIQCHLSVARFEHAPLLEALGFRLQDSRMVFLSEMTLEDVSEETISLGAMRNVRESDLPRIEELTIDNLVDEPRFRSRYKNPDLYTREESIRYYNAWNQLAFKNDPDLFAVWEQDGSLLGYYTYLRREAHEGVPLFKGGLTAVDQDYRGYGAQNHMQRFLFWKFGVKRWVLDNTTQTTNIAAIRNHIRAGKTFYDSQLTFYRINATPGASG
jgi:hypothetical protein